MSVQVLRMFHPTQFVDDLDEVEEWFLSAFGRESVRLEGTEWAGKMQVHHPGTPVDYCTFTSLADVLVESIDPVRHALDGVQRFDVSAGPKLTELAWYVEGLDEVYEELLRRGIGIERMAGSDASAVPPVARFADLALFWTDPVDTGLRYELYDPRGGSLDLRRYPGWTPLRYLAPHLPGDPLGLEFCSHHTVLTDRPNRALELVVDVLGGVVVHEGRSEGFAGDSIYVSIGETIVEYAVPHSGESFERSVWEKKAPLDSYLSITFRVTDLERAAEHLSSVGVEVIRQSETKFVTDPDTSLGTPWGFTSESVPGDPRA